METITETEYLAAMTAAAAAADSSSAVETGMSSRPCLSGEGCDVTVVTSRNPYHGQYAGLGPPAIVKHPMCVFLD